MKFNYKAIDIQHDFLIYSDDVLISMYNSSYLSLRVT